MKLKENEKIIKVIKPHYFTILILWVFLLGSTLVLLGGYFLFWEFSYKILFLIGILQISIIIFYYLYLSFELSILVVTNTRIIYVKRINIFQHVYAYGEFSKLQLVKAEQKGFFANYFWFGTLVIHTNSWEKICFNYIKDSFTEAQTLIKIIKENL